jgi:hypothetical protein
VNQLTPHTTGLSGDLGWPDAEDRSFGMLGGALLLIASTAYWGSTWLLSGLAPLSLLGRHLEPTTATNSTSTPTTRSATN